MRPNPATFILLLQKVRVRMMKKYSCLLIVILVNCTKSFGWDFDIRDMISKESYLLRLEVKSKEPTYFFPAKYTIIKSDWNNELNEFHIKQKLEEVAAESTFRLNTLCKNWWSLIDRAQLKEGESVKMKNKTFEISVSLLDGEFKIFVMCP